MSTSSARARAPLGGIFCLAVMAAPLGLALSSTPAGAVAGHALRPFLAQNPRTFPPAQVTFTVNTTNDTHDVSPGTLAVCADAAYQCSLRAAIEEANALAQTVSINVPAGSYSLGLGQITVSDPAGSQVVGAGTGMTSITDPTAASVFVTAPGAGGAGAFLALSNISLTNTHNTAAGPAGFGGAVSVPDSNDTLTVSGVVFSGNQASEGGAIYNEGQIWATNTTFSGNSTTGEGGAVYNDRGSARLAGDTFGGNSAVGSAGALFDENGPVSLDNSTFSSNSVTSSTANADGGAIFADDQMEFTNDTFTGNTATSTIDAGLGGAVYDSYGLNSIVGTTFIDNQDSSNAADTGGGGGLYIDDPVSITGSTFTGNTSANGDGGGLHDNGTATIRNSTISGNSARGGLGGGGVYVSDGTFLTDVLVSGNTANIGGGVAVDYGLQATGVAIVDNKTTGAGDAGGGVYIASGNEAHVDFDGVTVAGNVSDAGAGFAQLNGVTSNGGGTLSNSTVADNRTPGGVEQDCAFVGAPPQGRSLGSGGGNVTGDTSCDFTTRSDRMGPGAQGYWMTASDGGIFNYNAGFFGSMGGKPLNKPVVGMAHNPGNQGYWEVASDGGVFNFGDAGFFGSMGGKPLNEPVVGIASTPNGQGYIEVASDGGVFAFGDAVFYGSMGGQHLNMPIVAIAMTPDGRGYWEVASDGGIFNFGDAGFFGSMGAKPLNKPIVGIAAATDGAGYYEVASDGGVFNFGSGRFFGSAGSLHLNAPVVGIAAAPDNAGYWTFAADGGVFNYGSGSPFMGSAGSLHLNKPVVAGAGT